MNKQLLLLFFVLFIPLLFAPEPTTPESFIVQSKPKKESRNHINEDIASLLMHTAKESAQDIQSSAHVQEFFVEEGIQLFSQDKKSIFATAETEQLQEYRAVIKELSCDRNQWQKAKQRAVTKINAIKASVKK